MPTWKQLSRIEKVGAVYRFARKNLTAAQIAEKLATQAPQVHALAREEGIILPKSPTSVETKAPIGEPSTVNGDMWSRSEDERRRAFIEKARRGARERLMEMEKEDRLARKQITAYSQPKQGVDCVD